MTAGSTKITRLTVSIWGALSIVVCAAYAFGIIHLGTSSWQHNDTESVQTVEEATALREGCHNTGLLEYTHHPIGRAYLLTPFIGRFENLEIIPISVAALSGAVALFACLVLPTTRLMKLFAIAMFGALLFQGGFNSWIANLHQHSYNFSATLLLLSACITFRNVAWVLASIAFVSGWIGYDFIFAHIFTILTLRFVYWRSRCGASVVTALREAIGEASVFALVFGFDVLVKLLQNTIYFSSATTAFTDFYGSIQWRNDVSCVHFLTNYSSSRTLAIFELTKLYLHTFWSAPEWSSPFYIVTAAAIGALGLAINSIQLTAEALRSRAKTVAIAGLLTSGVLLVWFALAPSHAGAHGHLFTRIVLVPLLLGGVSVILAFCDPESSEGLLSPYVAYKRITGAIIPLTLLALIPLSDLGNKIDQIFFPSVWDPVTAGFRADAFEGPPISGIPSASSTLPPSQIDQPPLSKNDWKLVGNIGLWGKPLNDDDKSWMADPNGQKPHWYLLTFPQNSDVADIALRLYGRAKKCGAHTPEKFTIELLRENGEVAQRLTYPGDALAVVEQGKFLNFHRHLSPSVSVKALKITFDKTYGGGAPVLLDIHAFSAPPSH